MLLQQRNEEIDRQVNVLCQIVARHVDVPNGDAQAQDFLHLELDGALHFLHLGHHRLGVSEGSREFTSLVQTGSKQTGNLLDQSFTGKESIVFLGCK